jgi:serine/threonine protein kinase
VPVHPSSILDARLAQLLHARGRVSEEQLQVLLQRTLPQGQSETGSFLASSLVESGDLTPEEAQAYLAELQPGVSVRELNDWRPGTRVHDYVLEEELGRGGMGVVFRARHEPSGQVLAIKGVFFGNSEEDYLRFQREAELQKGIHHPNVLRVHGWGRLGSMVYLVMELAEGGSLAARLRHGPLLPAEAAHLVAQLARGLVHTHSRGVIHRDLKPGNVMFDADGTPKLIDFGLARAEHGRRLTQTGDILGTPAYMSPEQTRGVRDAVGAPSDVYSLGVVLFESLCGRPPFVGQGVFELMESVKTESAPALRSIGPHLSPGLEAICARALSKDPLERPSALQLAQDLEGWKPEVEAKAASRSVRTARLVAALLVGGVAGALLRPLPTPPPAPEASATPAGFAEGTNLNLAAGAERVISTRRARPTRGAVVLVPHEAGQQLGWIAHSKPGKVGLIFMSLEDKWLPVPEEGFLADIVGSGSRVGAELDEYILEARVIRRLGPLALVRFASGETLWRNAFDLTVLEARGDGRQPATLVFAPWSDGLIYAAYVMEEDSTGARVAFGDGDTAWVAAADLRRSPLEPGETVQVPRDGNWITGTVGETAGSLVEVRRSDSDEILWALLEQIRLGGE